MHLIFCLRAFILKLACLVRQLVPSTKLKVKHLNSPLVQNLPAVPGLVPTITPTSESNPNSGPGSNTLTHTFTFPPASLTTRESLRNPRTRSRSSSVMVREVWSTEGKPVRIRLEREKLAMEMLSVSV